MDRANHLLQIFLEKLLFALALQRKHEQLVTLFLVDAATVAIPSAGFKNPKKCTT